MPFGAPHRATEIWPQLDLTAWIFAKQAAFYRSLSGFIRASKEDDAEVDAAGLIVAFGALLLVGYMASEQLSMFTG